MYISSIISSISFPDPLPNASPTGSELQDFMTDIVIPELQGAIANLDAVSQSFNREWTEPFDKEIVESDYGDVLFFLSLFRGALASIYIQNAYDLDGDIDDIVNNNKTIEQFLNDEPQFLALAASPDNDLASAETNIDSGLEEEAAASLKLTGFSFSAEELGNFLDQLSSEPLFKTVVLQQAREYETVQLSKNTHAPIRLIKFNIECNI